MLRLSGSIIKELPGAPLLGLGFWCLNTTFNNISVISGSQFHWWRKVMKTSDLPQVTDKLYHIMYRVHPT